MKRVIYDNNFCHQIQGVWKGIFPSFEYWSCSLYIKGEGDKCHHIDGKIYCHDDFLVSGLSDSSSTKQCQTCQQSIFGTAVQVTKHPLLWILSFLLMTFLLHDLGSYRILPRLLFQMSCLWFSTTKWQLHPWFRQQGKVLN